MAKQIEITGNELWDQLGEGDLPDLIKVQGIEFTVEQIDKITHTMRTDLKLTIQRLRNGRLAVRTELMPVGIWAVYEPDGAFEIPGAIA